MRVEPIRSGQVHGLKIHALHLDPSSLLLISAFAFFCEAFIGITPSVPLLLHFLSLELVSEETCSGCVSLKMAYASAPGAPNAELLSEAEGFRRKLSTGDRGGGSVLPAPEIVEHLVVSSLKPHGLQAPESLAHEPTPVFLARGLRLPKRVTFPSPVAPPRVVLHLPSGPLLLGRVGPQGAFLPEEAPAREPPAPEYGFGLRDSSRASPVRRLESEISHSYLSLLKEADFPHRPSEDRHRELCTLNANLEKQARLRATLGGPPADFFPPGVVFRASSDSLALVEVEQSLERERLEMRERQVSLAEDSLASREAKLQEEIDTGGWRRLSIPFFLTIVRI
ncbi:hypothetical protein D1007_50462 [Hordeum vulgare]|nr:hypothetical protein D1007_50462 [Hordeum vulgare]